MNMDKKQYKKYAAAHAKPSPIIKNCIFAFLIGGSICLFGELLYMLYSFMPFIPSSQASNLVSVTLIFISVLLTGLGVYDKIAKHAGAGTLLPITGFANAVASPAMEYKPEGFVLGVGANMFKIAGPVIVYGTVASAVYGLIYWITTL